MYPPSEYLCVSCRSSFPRLLEAFALTDWSLRSGIIRPMVCSVHNSEQLCCRPRFERWSEARGQLDGCSGAWTHRTCALFSQQVHGELLTRGMSRTQPPLAPTTTSSVQAFRCIRSEAFGFCSSAQVHTTQPYGYSQLSKYGMMLADLLELLLELHTRGAIPPNEAPVHLPSLACFALGTRPDADETNPAPPGEPVPVEHWMHALAFDLGASRFARRDLSRALDAFTLASNVRAFSFVRHLLATLHSPQLMQCSPLTCNADARAAAARLLR